MYRVVSAWCVQLGKCRSVKEFEKMNRIGEGTYGIVCESQILINISHINSNIMYIRKYP